MLDPVQGQFGCRGEATFSVFEQAGTCYFLAVLRQAGRVDGNLWSRLAPSPLWCCTGHWASQAPQACRSAGRKSHQLSGRHTAAMFLFQKTAQHTARSVRIIYANLERKIREPQGAAEQPRAVSGSLRYARLSQLCITAPERAAP